MIRLLLIFNLFTCLSYSQNTAIVQWAFGMGGAGNSLSYVNEVTSVTQRQHEVIVCGNVAGTIDLDPAGTFNVSTVNNTVFNPFVAVYDTLKNFQWGFSLSGQDNCTANVIATDASGNIYLAGEFTGDMDADPSTNVFTLTSIAGGRDMYLACYSPTGSFIWAKSFGGNASLDDIEDMIVDDAGNIYITGTISDSVDFDPSSASAIAAGTPGGTMYLAKYSSTGDYIWSFIIDSDPHQQIGQSLDFDVSGNIVCGMQYHGTIDIDPSAATVNYSALGSRDFLVMTYDTASNYISSFSIGGPVSGPLISEAVLTVDDQNNITVAGRYNGTLDLDPGAGVFTVSSSGFSFVFISSYTADGSLRWGNNLGNGAGVSYAYDIANDDEGSCYLNWSFLSTPVITKFDSAGTAQYNKSQLTTGSAYNHAFHVERSNVFYSGGGFRPSLLLDSTAVGGNSGYTAFLARYADCLPAMVMSQTMSQSVCEESDVIFDVNAIGSGIQYAWYKDSVLLTDTTAELNLNHVTLSDSGDYYCIVSGLCGSDTSGTIHLSVTPLPAVTISAAGNLLMATGGLATYAWYLNGTPTGNFTQNIIATSSGAYFVVGTNMMGCQDTSPVYIYTSVAEHMEADVILYPVPASGHIVIESAQFFDVAEISDMSGRPILEIPVNGKHVFIDCSGIAPGSYLLRLTGKDYASVKKILITR